MDNSISLVALNICKEFNDHNVEYLLVGGLAVGIHGYNRLSTNQDGTLSKVIDIDIWYNPTYENYFRLLKALEVLSVDVINIKKIKSPNPRKSFLKFENDAFTLHLLPEIKGLQKFSQVSQKRTLHLLNGVELPLLNLEQLIESKKALSRDKDLIDIYMLKLKNKLK